MTKEPTITFGKYKGELLDALPASYLLWCVDQDWISCYPKLQNYILKNMKSLEKDAEAEDADDWNGPYDDEGNANIDGWKD